MLKKKNWILLCLSAILYALPFIFSSYLWWLVFIFLVPFFYVAEQEDLSFKEGFLWGIIVFGLHLSGVLYAITQIATGSYWYKIIPSLFTILYVSFFAGFLFWFMHKFINFFKIKRLTFLRLVVWIFAFMVFIFWLDLYSLWLFDRSEGYFLMHPLLPLAEFPQLLCLMPFIGKYFLTFLLFCLPASIVFFSIKRTKIYAGIIFLFALPWVLSLSFVSCQIDKPIWVENIAALQVAFPRVKNLTAMMNVAGAKFKKIVRKYPKVKLIIMPETSFDCSYITNPELTKLWGKKYIDTSLDIVTGAFRWKDGKYRNSLHWMHDGKIKLCFDKRHAMVLVERIPSWFNFSFVHDLYFKGFSEIIPSTNDRPRMEFTQLGENVFFIPYICSELFFNNSPDDNYVNDPIIAICNDSWFETPFYPYYVQSLMSLVARFRAIQWQRKIVYVAFSRAYFFDQYGNKVNLIQNV